MLKYQSCCSARLLTGQLSFGELLGAAQVVQVQVHVRIQQQLGLLLCGQGRFVQPAHQQTAAPCTTQTGFER